MNDEHTKFLYFSRIPALFPRMQNSISKNLYKRIFPISQREHRQPAARKLVKIKKKSRPKVQRRNLPTVFQTKTTWKQRRSLFSSQKGLLLIKTFSPSSLTIYLELEQFVLVPLSVCNSSNSPTIITKQEPPKCKPEETPTYHKDTLKKENNQQPSTSASPLVNKILEFPRIKFSNANTLILDGKETGLLLKDFAQRLKRKNVPIPDIYFTLLDAASITPDNVVNGHAKGKEIGARIPFKIGTTKVAGTLHAKICNMALFAIWQKQRESLRHSSEIFYIQKFHILGSHKQHVNSKE